MMMIMSDVACVAFVLSGELSTWAMNTREKMKAIYMHLHITASLLIYKRETGFASQSGRLQANSAATNPQTTTRQHQCHRDTRGKSDARFTTNHTYANAHAQPPHSSEEKKDRRARSSSIDTGECSKEREKKNIANRTQSKH